jgi:4-amino-4-deoxy-L-arabinose transferase-like glycosyltransferase
VWSLLPAVLSGLDPLWAARAVAALVGLVQLIISDRILVSLGGRRAARLIQAVIILLAPFWFFHQRMALMDGMLTLWLSLSVWGMLIIHRSISQTITPPTAIVGVLIAGVGWGLALWTKTPALFLAPVFPILAFSGWWLDNGINKKLPTPSYWLWRTLALAGAGLLGLSIFLLLKTQPNFGALFSRSEDFSFSIGEIVRGQWRTSLDNLGRLLRWLSAYLRPELLSMVAIALILSVKKRWHWFLIISSILVVLPLIIIGRTLHPRYFLPMALFLTPSAALFTAEVWQYIEKKADRWLSITFYLIVSFFVIAGLRFMLLSYFTPDQTPFVAEDRSQYLTEWSSGHGIPQVRDRLLARAQQHQRTTVVTEGSFGTLPDGLLLYFDRRPEIAWLRIEGLAQYPVKFLPSWVTDLAKTEEVWLMVNENRMELPAATLARTELIGRYPRPYGAPELWLYKILPTK